MYQNNGDGTFTDVTLDAGVSDGISLSFQSIWSDLNNDGWLDLYVINDLEHPNRLYLNNTNGTFSEVGEAWNASVASMDAMTASVGDYNNDGWQDIFITNTSIGQCALLRNTGNDGFENVASTSNVELNMLTWGSTWFDPDLDMDLDLYVCENNYLSPLLPNPYLKNNGTGFFVNSASNTFFFDNYNSYSVANLDWNQDGRADLAVNNFSPQNASFWRSSQPGVGWLKVSLHGTISNSQGIGAKIKAWVSGVQQTKELFAGENYLGQNTNTLLFGTNGAGEMDSLEVIWPSGVSDKWYNLPTNQTLQATEGNTYSCSIESMNGSVLCEGDSILLSVVGTYTEVLWDNQSTTSSIWVFQPGPVSVTTQNEWGISAESDVFVITASVPSSFTVVASNPLCFGDENGQIELLDMLNFLAVEWEGGSSTLVLDSLSAGTYPFTVWNTDGCVYFFEETLFEPAELEVSAMVNDAFCFAEASGSASISIEGGVSPYDVNWFGANPLTLEAGTYEAVVADVNGCEAAVGFQVEEPTPIEIEVVSLSCDTEMWVNVGASGGNPPYSWLWSNGTEGDSFQAPIGVYTVYATDDNGCLQILSNIDCPSGVAEGEEENVVVFPNPASDILQLDFSHEPQSRLYCIFDAQGRTVWEGGHTAGKVLIEVSDWPQGLYFFNQNKILIQR